MNGIFQNRKSLTVVGIVVLISVGIGLIASQFYQGFLRAGAPPLSNQITGTLQSGGLTPGTHTLQFTLTAANGEREIRSRNITIEGVPTSTPPPPSPTVGAPSPTATATPTATTISGPGTCDLLAEAQARVAFMGDRAFMSYSNGNDHIGYTTIGPDVHGVAREFHVLNINTCERSTFGPPSNRDHAYGTPVLSGDGRYAVYRLRQYFSASGMNLFGAIYRYDAQTNNNQFITEAPEVGSADRNQAVSKDGQKIVFIGNRIANDTDPATSVTNSDLTPEIYIWNESTGYITQLTDLSVGPAHLMGDVRFEDVTGRFFSVFSSDNLITGEEPYRDGINFPPKRLWLYDDQTDQYHEVTAPGISQVPLNRASSPYQAAITQKILQITGPSGLPQCRDLTDNDGDKFIDWPADHECTDTSDNDESS